MRIQHNLAAVNAHRQLTSNNSMVSKNLEKLSSGYKINRAGDDAAGLAISEKMRAQIKGLETAQANANDGISLVQTAEGALTEVHSMLNRMTELATKSANGTLKDEVDREAIQSEVKSLSDEIDRIAKSTNFNGITLLDGKLGSTSGGSIVSFSVESDLSSSFTDATAQISKTNDFKNLTTAQEAGDTVSYSLTFKDAAGTEQNVSVNFTVSSDQKQLISDSGKKYDITDSGAQLGELQDAVLAELQENGDIANNFDVTKTGDALTFTSKEKGADAPVVTNIALNHTIKTSGDVEQEVTGVAITAGKDAFDSIEFKDIGALNDITKINEAPIFEVKGERFLFVGDGVTDEDLKKIDSDINIVRTATDDITVSSANVTNMISAIKNATGAEVRADSTGTIIEFGRPSNVAGASTEGGLQLQVGDSAESFQKVSVKVGDMSTAGLRIKGLDVSSADAANAAIDKIKNAINIVSSNRAGLGAVQNRLEHTVNNLGVTSENLTAAESRIRDVDMAKEMMNFTKNNILTQAAQGMLAQANQLPQGVLQLLR
ncbi:flagellin N-terminal helical domain-containing protein [Anaerovorax odorimutans]|uniref:flagellin N-terminal helical domain-containing protein n=1 Tax=Anaerovorax odorimutans TaxID=109327 RepID=UPI0004074C07|nr:flagellin [Anaerovorax odorimutans]